MDYYEDEDHGEGQPEMTAEEYEMVRRRDAIDIMQINLAEFDLNQKLLFKVMKMLQKSFFWRFRRNKTKLIMIMDTYKTLRSVVEVRNE